MKKYYVADDGKSFDTEEKCLAYENSLIRGWTFYGASIYYTDRCFLIKAAFVFCPSAEMVTILVNRAKKEGSGKFVQNIDKPGLYYWGDDDQGYVPINDYVQELEQRVAIIKQIIKQIS